MDNRLENNNILDLDKIKIEFIDNDSSPFWFDVKGIDWFDVSIKNFDWHYLVELWNYDIWEWIDYLFDKNRNLFTWEERAKELENKESETYESDWYKLERKRKVQLDKWKEYYDLNVFLDWELVEIREYSAMWRYYSIEDEYKNFLRRDKIKSEEEKSREKYKNSSLDEKLWYWTSLIWSYIREWDKFDVNEIRNNREKNIDLFLNSLINSIVDLTELDRKDVIEKCFILDDIAKLYIKKEKIEWINISNEELAEKIWDLFYDSLSSFIYSLWEQIDNKEVTELLKEASSHIMNAWNICIPYVSDDFPEMKHTADIKWLDIDREELVKGISNLVNSELSDFLEKLSLKIEKDWEADKNRKTKPRINLANELFACAARLKEASKILK